jgi:hypothetical protein
MVAAAAGGCGWQWWREETTREMKDGAVALVVAVAVVARGRIWEELRKTTNVLRKTMT